MRYDFTEVQEAIADRGLTLEQVAALTGGAVDYTTISKALRRGTAHQSTAKALSKALRIPLKRMRARNGNRDGGGS